MFLRSAYTFDVKVAKDMMVIFVCSDSFSTFNGDSTTRPLVSRLCFKVICIYDRSYACIK